MAVDRKPEPPRSAAAWREWSERCRKQGDWGKARIPPLSEYPDWFVPERWTFTAEDHPFEGAQFCWRCVAEAQGHEVGDTPHVRRGEAICFQQAEGDPAAEDRDEDPGQARDSIEALYLGSSVISVEADGISLARFDAEGEPVPSAVDTGTLFWSSPPLRRKYHTVTEAEHRALKRLAAGLDLPPEVVPAVGSRVAGFPSWYPPEAADADQSERQVQPGAQPAEADYRDTWPPSWTDDEPGEASGTAGSGVGTEPRSEPDS